MARPRTLRTMIKRIDDKQLTAFWQLRNYGTNNSNDYKLVREAIIERVKQLKLRRIYESNNSTDQ